MQSYSSRSQVLLHRLPRSEPFSLHRGSLLGMIRLVPLMFSLLMALGLLALPVGSTLAKEPAQAMQGKQQHKGPPQHQKPLRTVYQGLILQVDRTNSTDMNFSILDRRGTPMTFHLTPGTQFAQHQSASQLTVNLLVAVKAKPNATGGQDATWVQLQQRNQAPFNLQGVVTLVNQSQKSVTLALSDGTLLTITIAQASITQVQPGATLSLQAHFDASGSLVASTYHIAASHASHFQARGIISHINTRSHRLTLVAPSGASFSVVQNRAAHITGALHVGEKVNIGGSTDSKGNLDEQSASVENDDEQHLLLEGIVSTIDTTANMFSLIDEDGNVATLNADPSLLSSIHVGEIDEVKASIAADGSLTAIQIEAVEGDDQGQMLSLTGVVQTYDANSGMLSLAGDNGESFTLLVNSQTQITADDAASPTLANGQEIHAAVQLNSDGNYTALMIEIQDDASSGDEMTFGGALQSYDTSSGQLTISTGESQMLSFVTNAQTEIEGAPSLDALPVGTFIKIKATVQQDGSYVATRVKATDAHGDD